jgi:hypothetical protein
VEVVEEFVLGKRDDPSLCEDAIVVAGEYAAVVDGATDISGRSYDGKAGGRWAMEACAEVVRALPPGIDALAAVSRLTSGLASRLSPQMSPAERPSAAVTIYSAGRREVWQIGDVGFHFAGLPAGEGRPRKLVDEVAVAFRVAVLAAEEAAGRLRPGAHDRGREAARALISRQGFLRNTVGPYGYAAIDGRPVPRSLVVVRPIPAGAGELVIASDGYPVIAGSLAESEATLARLLVLDPWCVRELAGTKGVLDGQVSFDDRAYLRLVV